MKAGACPRLFEAEAMRDGRLAGAELASFARHATVCAACGREVQALDALAEALRAGARRSAQTDELHTLRERTRLIGAFDETLVTPLGRRRALRPGLGPAAAAALVAGALLFWRSSLRPDIGASPGVVVQAGAAAIWSKRSDGNREKVVLDDGALWIHVDHSRSEAKLVVTLPDGELEDTGTTFTVSVANGRTTRVAVQEGSVVLRINGQPAVAIRGGTVWSPEPRAEGAPAPIPSSNDPETPPAYALPPIVSPTPDATQRRRSLSPQRVAAQRRAATARSVESPESVEPGTDFRAAVAVLDVGANRQAAAAFARFLVEHPRDPRAEDAAYLRVIALDRCGDTDETRRAAQAYLQLYPTGFRRAEIEKLSH